MSFNANLFYTVILPIFFTLINSSCKNGAKEKYLMTMNQALDGEIEWLNEKVEDHYDFIRFNFQKSGNSEKMKLLHMESDSIYSKFKTYYRTQKDILLYRKRLFDRIEIKNNILLKEQEVGQQLSKLCDSVKFYQGVEFVNIQNKGIVALPIKTHLSKGQFLEASIDIGAKPTQFSNYSYKAKIDNKYLYANQGALFEYNITSDSTFKMEPGFYDINGEIIINFGSFDSSFKFAFPYIITLEKCQ